MRGELLPGFFAQRTGVLGECGMRPAIGVAGRCQRREFDQAEEPAVKGVNRNARLCVEQFIEQAACGIHRGARLGVAQAALDQELQYLGIVLHQGKFAAPARQTLPHLAGRFAGESKREDRTRLGPRQQQPQHTRGQEPSLAAAGAGGDDVAARRVERVEKALFARLIARIVHRAGDRRGHRVCQ